MWLILFGLILLVVFGPNLWVRFTLARYSRHRDDLAGTGGQLAEHLIQRFQLEGVQVEQTAERRDHYDPANQMVRLSPSVLRGQSLTAVAVAAHEVGHAIQFHNKDAVTLLRRRYLPMAILLQKLSAGVLFLWPALSPLLHIPYAVPLHAALVGLMGLLSVFMYVAILPEEWDASFRKALPILMQGEYISEQDLPKVRSILRACALTYVASALVNVLAVWRWFRR